MDNDGQSQADAVGQTGAPVTAGDAVDVASQLTGALKSMTEQFSRLSRETKASQEKDRRKAEAAQKKDRRTVIALVVSVALDILLSIALIFTFVGQVHLNTAFRLGQQKQNASQSAALIKSCQASNVNKANDLKLWHYITEGNHPKTASQELALQYEQRLITIRDQPIDCVTRYGVK